MTKKFAGIITKNGYLYRRPVNRRLPEQKLHLIYMKWIVVNEEDEVCKVCFWPITLRGICLSLRYKLFGIRGDEHWFK